MAKYSLVMTQRHVEWLDALPLLGLRIHAPSTYLLTYLHRIISVFGDWPVI